MPTLSPEQTIIIGLIASVIAYVINEASKRNAKIAMGRGWVTVVLFALSLALAAWIQPAALPTLPIASGELVVDIQSYTSWAVVLVSMLAQLVGVAVALYNIILKRILSEIDKKLIRNV